MNNKLLSKTDILSADDIVSERVTVPEWGGDVIVRGLTGSQRDQFEMAMYATGGADTAQRKANIRATLVALSVVDEHGNRVFTDQEVEALGRKSASALDRVFDVATRLNAVTSKDVDDLAKKSEPSPPAASSSS